MPIQSFAHIMSYRPFILAILIGSIYLLQLSGLDALNNGLALLPPMGWSTWNAFGCKKCDNSYGTDCLSENAIQNVAQSLLQEGFSRLGYEYIIIDDCWQSNTRDAQLKLQPDAQIFPSGMKALAKFVHDRNLKLGIFSDLGQTTGNNYPGSSGYRSLQTDAQTFAEWDMDYVKMSAFTAYPQYIEHDYLVFGDNLKQTNRAMLYATSWPFFREYARYQVDYRLVAAHCNTWRFSGDAVPTWKSILSIMDTYALKQSILRVAHHGAWNDADLLLAGTEGITLDQAKAQMAVWAIMPSPLIFSANLRTLKPEMKALLQNINIINVNQDPLGLPGYKFQNQGDVDTWVRPITPTTNGYRSFAIAFVNRNPIFAADYSIMLQNIDLNNTAGYSVSDLFPSLSSTYKDTFMLPTSVLQMQINPSGVVMYKAEALRNFADSGKDRTARQSELNTNKQIIRYRAY